MKNKIIGILFIALLFAHGMRVYAGGPFVVDEVGRGGVPLRWLDNKLTWSYDEGPLASTVNNAEGVEWVRQAMDEWAGSKLLNAETEG